MPLNLITIEEAGQESLLKKESHTLNFPLPNEILKLIKAMEEKVLELNGVGLAAPQVNHPLKIIVFHVPESALKVRLDANEVISLTTLINPHYTGQEEDGKTSDWEGCFSVSTCIGKVPRYTRILYEGFSIKGEKIAGVATGFLARVLQHEIDHINGILITDRLTQDCLQGHPETLNELKDKEYAEREAAYLKQHDNRNLATPLHSEA